MNFVAGKIKWIMIVSGLLTCTMVYAAIAPQAALLSSFGQALEGPAAEIVVRNWGALIAMVGGMLVYGAFNPPVRALVLTVAGASKLVFFALVLWHGGQVLTPQAGLSIVIDLLCVALFALYLAGGRAGNA